MEARQVSPTLGRAQGVEALLWERVCLLPGPQPGLRTGRPWMSVRWLLCPGQLAGCRARLPLALDGLGPRHGPELCSCIFASFTSAP